jgi:hypothetical protein
MNRCAVIVYSLVFSVPVVAQNPAPSVTPITAGVTSTRQIRPRVDSGSAYERCYAIVPVIGSGTMADPRRPLYAPAPGDVHPEKHTGILGYHFELSDNGQFALVEFVAVDRTAFQALLSDSTVQSFVRGTNTLSNVVAAFQLLKKDFDISHFRMAVM